MKRSKQLARRYVWWPGIDMQLEECVRQCDICQRSGPRRRQHPLVPWKPTTFPMERIHLDHFFFEGKKFLIIVDDFSGWIEVEPNKPLIPGMLLVV